MSETNDGGAAFPRPYSQETPYTEETNPYFGQDGMSLRDWLTGQVVMGLLAGRQGDLVKPEGLAETTCEIADALVACLRKAEME